MTPKVVTFDTETHPITDRASYPPKAVGFSIKYPGQPGFYVAFGHASGNNATPEQARRVLYDMWMTELPLLGHNLKYDLDVLARSLDFPFFERRDWRQFHDTTYLLFLAEPHALSHGLKQSAARLLGWKAEERDLIAEWVWANRAALEQATGRKVTRRQGQPPSAGNAMEFMPWVPADLAGRYAVGDVERTAALFERLYPYVVDECGMGVAYDRERRLLPIWRANERQGIRCDTGVLGEELSQYTGVLSYVEDRIRHRLGASGLNFDADQEYAAALIRAGVVPEDRFERTAKRGDYRVGKDALTPDMFTDPLVASAVGYRNRLKTCLTMFMQPWYEQARNGDHVRTNWNSTRGEGGGTRTGRPSTSDPNFLNISKNFEGRTDGYVHPEFLDIPRLPLVRKYLLADEGHVWLNRDFSGQELRVFAHFERAGLFEQYMADANVDPHEWVRKELLARTGVDMERTRVKVMNFQSLYGGGVNAISKALRISEAEARQFKAYHDQALPGRKKLDDELKLLARRDEPIRTWGGRVYWCEEPRFDRETNKTQTFEYKLINYLVQGSAADLTKQAIIDWEDSGASTVGGARFLVQVYDEISISAPEHTADQHMAHLKAVMEHPRLDVPMLSDGKKGPGWGKLEKVK